MFGAYLQGFIGLAIIILSIFGVFFGLILAGVGEESGAVVLIASLLGVFGGGYMRYLSKQTNRSVDMYPSKGSAIARDESAHLQTFSGLRDIASGDYQLYLVEKYSIKKNETLGKFVYNRSLFESLEGALSAAAADESSNYMMNASGSVGAQASGADLGEPIEIIKAASGRKINLHRNNSGDICAVSLSGEVKTFDSVDEARSYFRN
jgi:hypothetical protein